MRQRLASSLAALLAASPAVAQSTLNRAGLLQQSGISLGSNNPNKLTAAGVQTILNLVIGNTANLNDANTFTGANVIGPSGSLTVQGATNLIQHAATNGGSGGTNGTNVNLTVAGGTCATQPIIQGTIAAGVLSVVTAYGTPGSCSILPTSPATVTGNGLSGATVNINPQNNGSWVQD